MDKTDFDTKLTSLNRKINSNETKYLVVENEFKKLKVFGLSYFRGNFFFATISLKICLFINQHLTHYKKKIRKVI